MREPRRDPGWKVDHKDAGLAIVWRLEDTVELAVGTVDLANFRPQFGRQ
jgi:hypothetical protein